MNLVINHYDWVSNGLLAVPSSATEDFCQSDLPLRINIEQQYQLPSSKEISTLLHKGITLIEIQGQVVLEDSYQSLEFIRFLRDVTSYGIRIIWGGHIDNTFPIEQLAHLYPPELSIQGINIERIMQWQNSYKFGLYFMRQGPDFFILKDKRPFRSPVTFTIGDPTMRSTFEKLNAPIKWNDGNLDEAEIAAAKLLLDHCLVLSLADSVIRLPYRINKWPIPAHIV